MDTPGGPVSNCHLSSGSQVREILANSATIQNTRRDVRLHYRPRIVP